MRSSHNRLPEVLALSTALALTGCTANDNDTPMPAPTGSTLDTQTLNKYFQDKGLIDPCDPLVLDTTQLSQERKQNQANDCSLIYKTGRVALINYDVPLPVAEDLANRAEDLIRQTTENYINLDITVVEPSEQARDRFKTINPENCYKLSTNNSADLIQFGSVIANATMPDSLNDKDYVVGLTSASECGTTDRRTARQGVSIPQLGNRFLEVLYANQGATHPEGEPFLDDAVTLTHELMHNLGLGHAGDLTFPEQNNPFSSEQTVPQSHIDLDLDALISQGAYEEYGDSTNSQGASAPSFSDAEQRELRQNNIQRERLHWPDYVISPNQPRKEQVISSPEIRLNTTDPAAFAIVELSSQIELFDANPKSTPQFFSQLAIVASETSPAQGENTSTKTYRMELFLVNALGYTVRLGNLPETTISWTISLGGKIISLNSTADGLIASATDQ